MAAAVAPASQDCFQFRNGNCSYGSNCRFLHDGQETLASRRKQTQICFEFRDKSACPFGDSCRYSHDLSLANSAENKEQRAPRAPREPRKAREPREAKNDNAGQRLECHNFKNTGSCRFGDSCRFLHAGAAGNNAGAAPRNNRSKENNLCFEFRDNGTCQFGPSCRFSHDPNAAAAPVPRAGGARNRQGGGAGGKKVCRDFLSGSCSYGDTCKFLHQASADQE